MRRILLYAVFAVCCGPATCWAVDGSDLVLNSSDDTYGSAAQLAGSGYVGTYITVPDAAAAGARRST